MKKVGWDILLTLENLHRKKKMKLAGAFIVYGVKVTSEKPLSDDGDEKVGLFNYSQESKFRNLGQIAVPNDEAAVITANIFEPQVVNSNIHPSWNQDLANYCKKRNLEYEAPRWWFVATTG